MIDRLIGNVTRCKKDAGHLDLRHDDGALSWEDRPAAHAMTLTGLGFIVEGSPEFILQAVKERLEEVQSTLPEGQSALRLRANLDHVKPKKPRVVGRKR